MSKQIPEEISQFVKNNGILTLATAGNEPWVCTLYYGSDENLNMYLVSDPDSVHGKTITSNSTIAFSIFDSHTKITESKKGIQGKGKCSVVTDFLEIGKGLLLWHKSNPGYETKITLDDIKKVKDTKIFKIVPTYLKFFNKDLYGKDEYGIWDNNL
jgi:uncharacterized protein YhbP (UPF0306 family)